MDRWIVKFAKVGVVLAFLLIIGLDVFAKEESEEVTRLDTVVVTATKKEATLLETPATISIITAEDIENSGQSKLADIIASVPGVIDDSSGFKNYFSFRGTRSTMSGGPVVYVDGKKWNFEPYGYNNIEDIPLETIERIEIIKSPSPSVYGANSARGVINIITKKGKYAKEPVEVNVSGAAGSWDTYKSVTAISGMNNKWDYSLSGKYEESDGYRHTDLEHKAFSGQAGYEVDEGIRIGSDIFWSNISRETGTALKYWALEDRRQNDPPDKETDSTYRIRPNESEHMLSTGGLTFDYDRDNWLLKSSAYLTDFDDMYQYLKYYNETTLRKNCYEEYRDSDGVDFKVSGGRIFSDEETYLNTITLGYDFSEDSFDQTRTYPYATTLSSTQESNIEKAAIDSKKTLHGIFVNNEFKYGGKLGLLAGLRYDNVECDVENEVPDSVKKRINKLGWNIVPSYSFIPDNNLFFSVSKSYWYPTSGYFRYAMQYGDTENPPEELEPEEYLNYELGFKHKYRKYLNYGISLFYTPIDNKYMSYYDDDGDFKGYKHIGDSIHKGVEIEVDGRPFNWFGYRLGFTLLDAEWESGSTEVSIYGETPEDDTYEVMDISGKKLYRVPEYEDMVGLDFYPLENWQFSVDLHGFGEQYIDALNRYKNKAVNLVDAKLTYTLKSWKFYIAGSNIFDVDYESIFNSKGERNSDGTPDHDYYPQDGQYVELGASVNF